MRVLVAGIGNIFCTDDGFGPEVIRAMTDGPCPDGVQISDFGIRGVHLAYQLLDGYDLLVLVDAAPHEALPGTVSLLEVDPEQLPAATAEMPVAAHGMTPLAVLQALGALGGSVGRVLVVACEPQSVEEGIGLSPAVERAVPVAAAMVQELMGSHIRTEVLS